MKPCCIPLAVCTYLIGGSFLYLSAAAGGPDGGAPAAETPPPICPTPLAPLSESVARLQMPNGEFDESEVAYVGTRCAALYTALSTYLDQGARNDDDRKSAHGFATRANIFLEVGIVIGATTGRTPDNIVKQHTAILSQYVGEIVSGKQVNNNAFTSFISADLEAAKKAFPVFEAFHAAFGNAPPGSVPVFEALHASPSEPALGKTKP